MSRTPRPNSNLSADRSQRFPSGQPRGGKRNSRRAGDGRGGERSREPRRRRPFVPFVGSVLTRSLYRLAVVVIIGGLLGGAASAKVRCRRVYATALSSA